MVELYSCIASESRKVFKQVFYLKQINFITGCPLQRGPGAIASVGPLNPALVTCRRYMIE